MEDPGRGVGPRVGELFQQAVQAQLKEQQAQRESIAEFSRRLEISERLMTDGLGAIAKVLNASEHALEHLADRMNRLEEAVKAAPSSPDHEFSAAALNRIEAAETVLAERIAALDPGKQLRALDERMAALEGALTKGLDPGKQLGGIEQRMAALEATLTKGLDPGKQLGAIEQRMAGLEATVTEKLEAVWHSVSGGVEMLAKNMEMAGERYSEALEEARLSREMMRTRLTDLEGSVRSFEEQTSQHMVELRDAHAANEAHLVELRGATAATESQLVELRDASAATEAQLVELRDASVAAEAGILERIILESQTVATHFETVRPAVEAAANAAPELETTLNELRELAERVAEADTGETGPYSAEDLLAPMESDEGNPLFQPPEETPIPERRFWGRDR